MQFKFFDFQFKPTLMGTVITLICIPVFIKLGFWQYNKAMLKQSIQAEYNKSALNGALDLVGHIQALEALQYQRVKVFGEYATKYQILIDNRIENDQAGFHVITPFKIQNSNGWLRALVSECQERYGLHFEFGSFEFSPFVSNFEIRISCFINLTTLPVFCAEKD